MPRDTFSCEPPMNQATQSADPLEPESPPAQAPSVSPLPTPAASGDTPLQSAAIQTRSFDPISTPATLKLAAEPPVIPIGSVLDGYVLVQQIGRGGMGIVFKARQPASEAVVAVKVIRDSLLVDPTSRDRFVQEIRAMGRLQSAKNIVPIYHVSQCDSGLFYVMPFLAGGALSHQRERFRADRVKAVGLVEKIARAVHQLHAHDILHRDIKPGNILLDADDEPYLSDFGLAKLLDQDQALTESQQRLGTPAYMAPEQTGLLPTPMSPQTDIWALGVLLYELLVGVRPFVAPDAEVSTTLLWKIVNEAPPRPRKVKAELDPGLEAVILKCLEKQPADRFASAEELADELGRWLRQEKLKTPPVSLGTKVRRFVRKHPRVVVAMALLSVTIITMAAVAYDFRRRSSPEYIHETLRGDLIDGGKVTLIPEEGVPRWFQTQLSAKFVAQMDHEEHWQVDNPENYGIVELLRDIPFETYKVRAEIRHLKSTPMEGRVGIVLGHYHYAHNEATPHFWTGVTFNDFIEERINVALYKKSKKPLPEPGSNVAQLSSEAFSSSGQAPSAVYRWQGPSTRFVVAGVNAAVRPWRVLELELHKDRIVCSFDGKALPAKSRAALEKDVHENLGERQANDPKYLQFGDVTNLRVNPRGSLGLIVCNGSVVARNFTVTRIP